MKTQIYEKLSLIFRKGICLIAGHQYTLCGECNKRHCMVCGRYQVNYDDN